MSVSLLRPSIIGLVDPGLLAQLEKVELSEGYDEEIDMLHMPLYKELARLAGVESEADWLTLARSSDIRESGTQVKDRGWHYDYGLGYMVSDKFPTEFLLAESDVVKSFYEKHIAPRNLDIDLERSDALMPHISYWANRTEDSQLIEDGFEIWNPEPFEVVAMGPTDIHRSTCNPEPRIERRNFALLYHRL